jgi:D-beta-D-heptose 7-phosphate kinase/D-beta-D-heptose 1-phosphate adenosyltransferase
LEQTRLFGILERFRGKRVVVVGDCMLDEYLWGRVSRISPEAPVMVIEQERTTYALGGASNVAANIVAMDGRAAMIAVVGEDPMAERLRAELNRQGVRHDGLVALAGRPTTVKTRIIAHSQQVVRVDREDRRPVSADAEDRLLAAIRAALAEADALLFSDYSKGVLTERLVVTAAREARRAGRLVLANTKPASAGFYRGIDLVSVNQSEAEAITGLAIEDEASVALAGERLLARCGSGAAFITRGGHGVAVVEQGAPLYLVNGIPQEVYDVAGAGDSVIAAAALARLAGASWPEAAQVANYAGNAKVRKLGVVPVTRHDIETVWAHAQLNGYH